LSADAASAGDPGAKGEAATATPSTEDSPAQTLARDLYKAGGRRIAWSATKKRFIVPVDVQVEAGRGLDLRFYDDEGQRRDIQRVCQPGECEEHLDELVKALIPKLAARLTEEGYEAVYSVGWPSGRDEIEVSAIGGRLRYRKGRLSLVRDKRAPVPLRGLGGRSPKTDELAAVYPVPAAKLLAVFAGELFLYKLP
jgi:hypothetical protein